MSDCWIMLLTLLEYTKTSIHDTFGNDFHPKKFLIFQIFAILHGGAESAHFLILNI